MLKKIDKLLIKSFLPPFFLTFFIALFVLIMSFLWTYVDEIVGKGADVFILSELIFYLSVSLFPTALPIAVLISSVMVMGNLAERYELTAIKSAGVPLLRTMAPLMLITFIISIFSYVCADKLIPVANLQFKTRLFDIRRHKPMLNLEAGVFNDDFKGFTMYIGKKAGDGRGIENVLIYDHNSYNRNIPPRLLAEKGEMYTTDDQRYFVMNLFDGRQYQEVAENKATKNKKYPFTRVEFKEWKKVFDLGEFEINQSDQRIYKSHHAMLSTRQLIGAVDSLDTKIFNKAAASANLSTKLFSPFKEKLMVEFKEERKMNLNEYARLPSGIKKPTKKTEDKKTVKKEKENKNANKEKALDQAKKRDAKVKERLNTGPSKPQQRAKKKEYKQSIEKPLSEYSTFLELFGSTDQKSLVSKGNTSARNVRSQVESNIRSWDRVRENRVKHIFELHSKFTVALACFIFLFIGAPMGAIIRKGGFGFPILIAIIFFILFTVLNILCKKIAETFVLDAVLATWLPILILAPIGLFLTSRAMKDKKIMDIDMITQSIAQFFSRFSKRKKTLND